MITNKEMEERKHTVGASEVYKLSNFDGEVAQAMWEEKVGIIQHQEISNDSIDAGNILEEQCLDFYENQIGKPVYRNERIEHKDIKNFVVNLDGRELNRPVENKCINQKVFDKWKSKRVANAIDENGTQYNIPKSYYMQVQAQMECLETRDKGTLLANALTDEEVMNPLEVEITDLHQTALTIYKDEEVCKEIRNRVKYMLDCMEHKRRPSETEYLTKYVF